jgi:class 3 adenylate cyclase
MAEENVTRKLTAILYADVAGYSRLTGEDEVGTHKQLSAGLDLISAAIKAKGAERLAGAQRVERPHQEPFEGEENENADSP